MSLREELQPDIDGIRSIPGELGLRQWRVYLKSVSNDDTFALMGDGDDIESRTEIRNIDGYPPRVQRVSTQEIISGGIYRDQDLKIGPITPDYSTGGWAPTALDNPDTFPNLIIDGPGINSNVYRVQEIQFIRNFSYFIIARAMGVRES